MHETAIQEAILTFWNDFKQKPGLIGELQSVIDNHQTIKHGENYWREVSEYGAEFALPGTGTETISSVLAWSRILSGEEILCAINLNPQTQIVLYVTIDCALHAHDSQLKLLFGPGSIPSEVNIEERNGRCVRLVLPPDTLVIYG